MGKPFLEKRDSCPVCASKEGRLIYELSYEDQELSDYLVKFYDIEREEVFSYLQGEFFRVISCDQCKLVYQQDIPTSEMMDILYEKWIDPSTSYHDSVNLRPPSFFKRLANEHHALLKYFNQSPDRLHFFDFGMGWGTWCKMGHGFGIKTYGAELSAARQAHCKEYGIEVVDLSDVGNHQFEVINTDQVFEHLANPFEILSQLVAGLRPGGLVHIFVPNGFDIQRRLQKANWSLDKHHPMSLNPIAPLEHINCFNQESLVHLGKRLSLKLIDLEVETEHLIDWKERVKSVLRPIKELVKPNPFPFQSTNLYFVKEV